LTREDIPAAGTDLSLSSSRAREGHKPASAKGASDPVAPEDRPPCSGCTRCIDHNPHRLDLAPPRTVTLRTLLQGLNLARVSGVTKGGESLEGKADGTGSSSRGAIQDLFHSFRQFQKMLRPGDPDTGIPAWPYPLPLQSPVADPRSKMAFLGTFAFEKGVI